MNDVVIEEVRNDWLIDRQCIDFNCVTNCDSLNIKYLIINNFYQSLMY